MTNYFRNLLSAQAHSLLLPKRHKAEVERYVLVHQTTGAKPERAPFHRQVDFWAFSIATALAKGLMPLQENPPSKWGDKFVDTHNVEMSDDLCALLAVVTVAHLGLEHTDVGNGRRIIDLGNRLAAVGCPIVLDQLAENVLKPALDRAIDFARDLYQEVQTE